MKCFMAYLAAVTVTATLWAQSARIRFSFSTGSDSGSFLVLVDSSSGSMPVALQCDLVIPPAIRITPSDIQLGSAAAGAGKELSCGAGRISAAMVRYTCILAGGREQIPNGPILAIRYVPLANAGGAPVRIGIEKGLGVLADATAIRVPDSEAISRIR
jgi:hypothetical protein